MASLMLVSAFTACSSDKGGKEITNATLVEAITNSGAEGVEYNPVTGLDSEESEDLDLFFQMYEMDKENFEAGAFSVSLMNIKAYAIMAVMPKEGAEEAALEDIQSYVDAMNQAFEHYLADQYEVAQNAILKVQDNGLIILVMTEDAQTIYDNIVAALA